LRLAEVDAAMAALRDSDLPTRLDEIDELEKEHTWIITVLGQAQGLHGTARRLGDDRNRVRNRVCNAVRRACAEIALYDRPLAEHLAKPVLNLGHHLCYVPRGDLCWSTTLESVAPENAPLHEK
jgi:hypothetical protein